MSFKMRGFHDNMKQMTFEKDRGQIHHNTMLNTSKEKMQSENPNY